MKAGDLRHRITLLQPIREKDERGRVMTRWQPLAEVYAQVMNVSGRDFFAAAAYHMEDVVTFTIRVRPDLSVNMRVLWRGKAYRIMEINNLSYQGDYLRIRGKLAEPEG